MTYRLARELQQSRAGTAALQEGNMKSTLIRTAVLASLITALAVSAVAYYALPHTSAQADNQGSTLQPASSADQAQTPPEPRPALQRRAHYAQTSTPALS